jgi:hypothetical protein
MKPVGEEAVAAIRRLAKKRLPLGEIAKRLGIPINTVRAMADTRNITLVRDNRTGGPRAASIRGTAQSEYAAKLRSAFVAKQAHEARLAKAPPLTADEEQRQIAAFLQTKGATQCPTVYLEATSKQWEARARIKGAGTA